MQHLCCKSAAARWLWVSVVMCMLLSLFGCAKGPSSPEETARKYLEKKYGGVFCVEELTRKENGPFMTDDYSGWAYREGEPLERFTVWVNKDGKTVKDARYTLDLLPAVRRWVRSTAEQFWDRAETAVVMQSLSYNSRPAYDAEDFRSFYRGETVNNTVMLILPEREDLVDKLVGFSGALAEEMTGYINVYISADGDPETLWGTKPDVQIMIGSDRTVIERKLEGY